MGYLTFNARSNGVVIISSIITRIFLYFLLLIVFGGPEALFVYILLCRPSEDSLEWSTIPDGSASKDRQSTVGWGDCRIWTRDCRFTVWCCCQWATTPPMSHHSSMSHHSVQYRDGHISTCSIKTLVIYLYCAYCALCQFLYSLFINCCSLLIIVVHLFCSLLDSHLFFVQLLFHCSLFKRKRLNSDPRLYSRYFDPAYHHHLCKSINIIHQTAPT